MGDEIALVVPIAEAGSYQLRLACAMDQDSGRITMKVNGEGGVEVDLNRPYRTLLRCFDVGTPDLREGEATITVKYAGDPPGGSVGLDFIWLQKR